MYIPELTIVGFPKCGTSALMRALESMTAVSILRSKGGSLECSWPQIKHSTPEPSTNLLVHKFTAYIYNPTALTYLARSNPSRTIVLCVRRPRRALLSWYLMHRNIARRDSYTDHFAYREREFYATCTLEAYMDRFARDRLQYDRLFLRLLRFFSSERIVVVWQERMALGIDAVAEYLVRRVLHHEYLAETPCQELLGQHFGAADVSSTEVPFKIREELSAVEFRLRANIQNKGVFQLDISE